MPNPGEKRPGRTYRFLLNTACFLLLAVCFLFSACGRKGDPTLKAYEKPQPPSHITAVCRPSEIILTWDFPKDKQSTIKGFYLMRASDRDFERIAFLENNKRTYTDTHFNPAYAYKYKIISQNLRGVTGHDSTVIEVKPKTLPEPPVDLSFTIEYNVLTLSWKSPEEEKAYNVYKSDKQGMYPDAPFNKQPVKGHSFRDTFDMNKPVFYTIRSITGDGVRYEGPASAELAVNPLEFMPSQPEHLQATVTPDSVYLIWKEPSETWITGYRVYREIKKKQGFVLIGEPQIPSFTDKEKASSKRSYRVTAVGPAKEGPPAEIRDVVYIKPR
jgi:Prokaryotic lipoprotein-attachment site